ncbi:MAG: hypothetical protein LRZ85_03710 [Alphaproteobacteria bacterium]|nr:hypothetical protein [Alphaproteobacteria bacterium]MCD8570274.1 hypothetical protein [Alphaproteobacteria bacterium]
MIVSARFFVLTALCCSFGFPAWAEGPVSVRTGDHDIYSRIVFDWKKLEGYRVDKQDIQNIVVTFNEPGTAPSETIEAFNVVGFKVLSSSPFKAQITTPPHAEFRYFAVGDRVVVDIYDAPGRDRPPPEPPAKDAHGNPVEADHGAEQKKPSDEPELGKIIKPDSVPVRPPSKKPEDEPPAMEEKKVEAPAHNEPAEKKTSQVVEMPPPPETRLESPAFVPKPNLISISGTQSYGLAAFETGDKIVMAVDVPGILLKPQVSGDNTSLIAPISNFEIDEGRGFMAKALKGTKIRAEGGGLLWNLVITPEVEGLENAPIERRDGSLFVPLKNIRKTLNMVDPYTGSDLTVITVSDSESRVGDARSFVDFDILASAAGLAVRPKADGVEVKIVPDGVEITKPGGLVMTPPDHIDIASQAEKRRQEMASRDEKSKQETGQVLFDFKEWRMGGAGNAQSEPEHHVHRHA